MRFLSTLSLRRATAIPGEFSGRPQISIHALLAESDCSHPSAGLHILAFLSTLSLRRATRPSAQSWAARSRFLSTLSLRRATTSAIASTTHQTISIHALLAESDVARNWNAEHSNEFLSTLSLRRATNIAQLCLIRLRHFYPRSPCGERLQQQSDC